MMRVLRLNAHLLQIEANLAAHILALVQRSHIQITGPVLRAFGNTAILIKLQQIKLAFRAQPAAQISPLQPAHRLPQHKATVAQKGLAVRVAYIAKNAHHSSGGRPPGQKSQRGWVREQQQLRRAFLPGLLAHKTLHSGGLKGDTVPKSLGQFIGHYANIFLPAKNIAKGQTDKLNVVFLHKLQSLFNCASQ